MNAPEVASSSVSWSFLFDKQFRNDYAPIISLVAQGNEGLILHDLQHFLNHSSHLVGIASKIYQLDEVFKFEQNAQIDLNKFTEFANFLEAVSQKIDRDDLDYRIKPFINLFDISHSLVREILFLKAPDRRRLEALHALTIDVAEYCELRQVDFIQDPDRITTITALEFLPIFNLIENGTKFQHLWNAEHNESQKVRLEQHENNWILTNDSLTSLPDDCFVMGKKGENGNTGTGLALAKLFAHLQGNEVTGSSDSIGEKYHQVMFKIAPQIKVIC